MLRRPFSIGRIRDGGIYEVEPLSLVQTNLFLKVGCSDELFVKVPSNRGFDDYLKFVKFAQSSPEDIRALEPAERFEMLEETLEALPALQQLRDTSVDFTHYLAVHKLQYERMRGQTAVEIPRAKFGLLRLHERGLSRTFAPAIFQEKIPGTTLWDMFDFGADQIRSQWRPFLPTISAQLSELLDTGSTNHIDWNIKNFLFDDAEERLFYIDVKPSLFVARHSNRQNLRGVRDHFLL